MTTNETERASLPASHGSATTTWYKTGYDCRVEAVAVVRFTEKCVWTYCTFYKREARNAIISDYHRYFPTREGAVAYLIERETKKAEGWERQAAQARANVVALSQNNGGQP